MIQPIVFPGGPVACTQERDRLHRKKVEETHLQHLLVPKKRTRINSKANNKNSNADMEHPDVEQVINVRRTEVRRIVMLVVVVAVEVLVVVIVMKLIAI